MAENLDNRIITEQGKKELEERLAYLKGTKRNEIAERIKIARGYGDLSENAEYEEAKDEQGFVEGEINELENRLKNVIVVTDDEISTEIISVGTVIRVRNLANDQTSVYQIVGTTESNIQKGKLSNVSPVGQGLLGHRKGEQVTIEVPAGEVRYEILDIMKAGDNSIG